MLELLYTSTKVVPFSQTGTQNIFMRDWDAMLAVKGALYKVFRDGTTVTMGGIGSNVIFIANANGRVTYYSALDKKLYSTCPFTAQPIYTQQLNAAAITLGEGDFIDEDLGLAFHRVGGGYNISAYDLYTGTLLRTFTIGQFSGIVDGNYTLTSAGKGRFCAVSTNGYVTIYDYISWLVVQKSYLGNTVRCGVYDTTYQVLLGINTSNTTFVYSLEELGTGLSAPVFTPTGNKYLLSGYIVTTRFLGSGSTPMASEWINWEVVGGKGHLDKDATLTDADGYAYNYYWTPEDVSGLGSETIRVWCEI